MIGIRAGFTMPLVRQHGLQDVNIGHRQKPKELEEMLAPRNLSRDLAEDALSANSPRTLLILFTNTTPQHEIFNTAQYESAATFRASCNSRRAAERSGKFIGPRSLGSWCLIDIRYRYAYQQNIKSLTTLSTARLPKLRYLDHASLAAR